MYPQQHSSYPTKYTNLYKTVKRNNIVTSSTSVYTLRLIKNFFMQENITSLDCVHMSFHFPPSLTNATCIRGVSESSRTVIVVTASVKDGRPRSHFRKPIASVCHLTPCCEHALFLYECFFNFVFRFVCNGWQNRATCLHQVLREAR
jgi:hypothetical protein